MGGEDAASAVADTQDLVAFHRGDEADLGPGPDLQVGGLVYACDEVTQVWGADLTEEPDRPVAEQGRPQRLARPVPAVIALDGEVAVDEHREQPVRGGPGHVQTLGRIGDPQRSLLLKELREMQGVVDGPDRVGRLVLHSRKSYLDWQNSSTIVGMDDFKGRAAGLAVSQRSDQPEPTADLQALYRGFERELLVPLWTEIGELMPAQPVSKATAHLWRWDRLLPLAEQAGALVPVGRGGERRAIALANPGLGGAPFATSTLWAAIQYLGPREVAPEHRHTQNAFRFVVEGEGVWTVVDGDPVAMRRGDFLLTPGWHFHGHHNAFDAPMAWLDGLDIPFVHHMGSAFFEFGADEVSDRSRPERSRAERLWAHPGLRPVSQPRSMPSSPIVAYRWEHTDAALSEQLALENEGHSGVIEPGHAGVRFTNPTSGGDVMATLRAEFHRLRAGATTAPRREVGSAVWQVFDGTGRVRVGHSTWTVGRGDLFVVPSWQQLEIGAETGLDLFRFSDTPIFEQLNAYRVQVEGASR